MLISTTTFVKRSAYKVGKRKFTDEEETPRKAKVFVPFIAKTPKKKESVGNKMKPVARKLFPGKTKTTEDRLTK